MRSTDNAPAFLTYGWCRTTYAVMRSLGPRGVPLHVGDASRLAMCRASAHCASFRLLPDFFRNRREYFQAVLRAMRETGSRVLLPCHEDVGIFAERRDEIPSEIRLAVPDIETYRLVEDKHEVLQAARGHGVEVPRTRLVKHLDDLLPAGRKLGWPVILKTRIGNSAKGVRTARNERELREMFDGLVGQFHLPPHRWPFLQEYLPGLGIGVCGIFRHGECLGLFGEQYLRCKDGSTFGTSTLRCAYHDAALFERTKRLFAALRWHGLAHCDYLLDARGVARLIEINPRPWGAMWLSVAAGVDFPYLWYLLAQNSPMPRVEDFPRHACCRWVLGDLQAALALLRSGDVRGLLRLLRPRAKCAHDDWTLSDPAPFIMQAADYALKMFRGGMNPVVEGMVQ